ncbi:unnamed protein product [Pipistrellus nathusii]|uniref:Tumour necrosis factor receptor 13C TALL-1 binding domain-containing protein n=1 Tax=Pipistrellus nathusii TaxID=59473 RepID=A0ABP0A0E4_PIPNA
MGARGRRGRSGPPSQCPQPQCFDPLVRVCVACSLLRTLEPPAAEPSSAAAGTAVRSREAGAGPGALLLGAPALLGLALALVLAAALGWRRLRRPARPEAPDSALDDAPLDTVIVLSSGPLDATGPVWPAPGEDPATMPPAHSVPVPATELGSTELVTTKTAGPEQQ